MASLSACWDWKVEPVSPGFISPDYESDAWGLDDDVTLCPPKLEKNDFNQNKSSSDFLDDLDEYIKEEEPFADWLEEKIDLPLLNVSPSEQESYVCHPEGKHLQPAQQYVVGPGDTQSLLQEFESVFGEVENNYGLTPPQSPTRQHQPEVVPLASHLQFSELPQNSNRSPFIITTLQQMIPVQVQVVAQHPLKVLSLSPEVSSSPPAHYQQKEQFIPDLEQIVPSPAPDIDEELAAVDELIRTRVEDLETSISPSNNLRENENGSSFSSSTENVGLVVWENESSINFSSPENVGLVVNITPPSPSTTSNSSFESVEDQSDDPEWVPDPLDPSSGCHKVTGGRKRSKPYARVGTEEKRLRKKEQNKNAATRYRQKKKAEVEEILTEEKQLADRNEELQAKVSDISREIRYLKGLMRDVFKAKGLLK